MGKIATEKYAASIGGKSSSSVKGCTYDRADALNCRISNFPTPINRNRLVQQSQLSKKQTTLYINVRFGLDSQQRTTVYFYLSRTKGSIANLVKPEVALNITGVFAKSGTAYHVDVNMATNTSSTQGLLQPQNSSTTGFTLTSINSSPGSSSNYVYSAGSIV